MKIALKYGAVMAMGGALLTLLLSFTGLYDSADKLPIAQWVGALVSLVIAAIALALAMREKRAYTEDPAGWTYGSALGVGVLTALVGALLGGMFGYVFYAYLNPDMSETLVQAQLTAMEEKGLSVDQIDRAEPMMRKWMSPGPMAFMQTFMGFVWGVVVALIVAIFHRRPPTLPGGDLPPVVS